MDLKKLVQTFHRKEIKNSQKILKQIYSFVTLKMQVKHIEILFYTHCLQKFSDNGVGDNVEKQESETLMAGKKLIQ